MCEDMTSSSGWCTNQEQKLCLSQGQRMALTQFLFTLMNALYRIHFYACSSVELAIVLITGLRPWVSDPPLVYVKGTIHVAGVPNWAHPSGHPT